MRRRGMLRVRRVLFAFVFLLACAFNMLHTDSSAYDCPLSCDTHTFIQRFVCKMDHDDCLMSSVTVTHTTHLVVLSVTKIHAEYQVMLSHRDTHDISGDAFCHRDTRRISGDALTERHTQDIR